MQNLNLIKRCTHTQKICYTERAANEILNFVKRNCFSKRKRKKTIPKRKYYCIYCGFYHLTHMSEKKYRESA